MPKRNFKILSHFVMFCLLISLCVAAQTILWPALNLPQPQLWILPFVFIILYQSFWYSLLFTYATTCIITGFTALPIGLLLAVLMILFVFIQFIKQRFFWPEFSFFFLVSLSAGFLFPIFHFFLSFSHEAPAIVSPEISLWLLQPVMMAIFSYFLYYICQRLDQWSKIADIHGIGVD